MTSSAPPPPERCGRLRSDAERNRDRIVTAAREAYATDGLGVSMNDLARRAGIGIATLFRRFPTRDDLIAAVFADTMAAYHDAATAALTDPDPWRGFAGYLETVCAMQAANRGFADVLTTTFPTAKSLETTRQAAFRALTELITRAQEAGRLRPDFTPEDVAVLLMANAGVVAATGDAAPDAWRRHLAYLLQAYGQAGPAPLPPSPAPRSLYRAMLPFRRC